jgi:hypothetical protein
MLISKYNIKDNSNNPTLDVRNPIVIDLLGVDIIFTIFLLVLYIYFVINI